MTGRPWWVYLLLVLLILGGWYYYSIVGFTRTTIEARSQSGLEGQWVGPVSVSYHPDGNESSPAVQTRGALSITWRVKSKFTDLPEYLASGTLYLASEGKLYPFTGDHAVRMGSGAIIEAWASIEPVPYLHNGSFRGETRDDAMQASGYFGGMSMMTFTGDLRKGTDADFDRMTRQP